jgi:hypothetical protein
MTEHASICVSGSALQACMFPPLSVDAVSCGCLTWPADQLHFQLLSKVRLTQLNQTCQAAGQGHTMQLGGELLLLMHLVQVQVLHQAVQDAAVWDAS